MPSRPPKPPPKGTRHPGAGRAKGTPNRISVAARTLASELVNDPAYQWKLRGDFRRRKLHPTIESLIWQYHLGKPRQPVEVSGALALDINARIEEEREIFAALDLAELEQLAAESQALVDRAQALSRARLAAAAGPVNASTPQDVVSETLPGKEPTETLGKMAGSDNGSSVNSSTPEDSDDAKPTDTES